MCLKNMLMQESKSGHILRRGGDTEGTDGFHFHVSMHGPPPMQRWAVE